MENWKINKIFYYEVNGVKFYNKDEANDYSIKLFLTNEINKLMKKSSVYKNYSTYVSDKDYKTIIVYIYKEPFVDTWNVGHYGCKGEEVNRSKTEEYTTIKDYCKRFKPLIEKLFTITDSIDIENLSFIQNGETVEKMVNYKKMVKDIKQYINF